MLTKPIRNLESLEVTFSTVFIAMSGYFFFYLANGLQKYDFEMGLDLSGYVTLVMITGIFFVSWASYIIYGGFLHLAAKVMGGTGKFNLTATALGHAVLLPSLIGVIIGFFWVYTGTTDPLIASSITCGILIVTSSIVAIKVVNELSWGRAIAAYALLPITTVVLGFALFYLTFLN